MSATPVDQQQLPPPLTDTTQQQAYSSHGGHGSVGAVIAVLAVITILGVIAGMIGRLCSGRRIMGHGQYDVEGWVERKCSSCLDGHIGPPPRPRAAGGGSIPREDIPVEAPPPEIKVEGQETQRNSHENGNNHS